MWPWILLLPNNLPSTSSPLTGCGDVPLSRVFSRYEQRPESSSLPDELAWLQVESSGGLKHVAYAPDPVGVVSSGWPTAL